ncbi:hypothetical protein ACH3XW_31635 [Acanthocheilonema viteae]
MVKTNLKLHSSFILLFDFILLMIISISSTNSNKNNEISSRKMQQSEILPKHRIKRFWTEVRPLKRDYPDFDDDREGEEYYHGMQSMIQKPRNIVAKKAGSEKRKC